MENYKTIEGYENYEVSDLGNVRNIKTGKILKPMLDERGYLRVNLCNTIECKKFKVHQLIAIAFLDHIPNGNTIVVDHINNDRLDNTLENLQLITQRLNISKDQNRNLPTGVLKKPSGRYSSRITIDKKQYNLGTFNTPEEASQAYQTKLKEIT